MKKIAVILSGSGFLDGAEIRESVLTLLAIDKNNAEAVCFAPNINQHHVVNHLTMEESNESRNVLVESARIARGKITDIKEAKPDEFDAVIMPGGYGVAKNICNFAFKGVECDLNEDVANFIIKMNNAGKPVGAICISPAFIAKVFEGKSPILTIGCDEATKNEISKTGASHVDSQAKDIIIDEKLRLVTTAAYMYDDERLININNGIESLVNKIIEWA